MCLEIAIRTGIDGCPVPEHTDLAEASIACHTAHMIHDDGVDEGLMRMRSGKVGQRDERWGLKVFWSIHTFLVSKVGFEIPGRVVERVAKHMTLNPIRPLEVASQRIAATSADVEQE